MLRYFFTFKMFFLQLLNYKFLYLKYNKTIVDFSEIFIEVNGRYIIDT